MEHSDNYHYLVFGPQSNIWDKYLYSNYIGDYVVFNVPKYINQNNYKEYESLTKYFKNICFLPKDLLCKCTDNCISWWCNYNDFVFVLDDINKLVNHRVFKVVILHILDFDDNNSIKIIDIKQYGIFDEIEKVFDNDELSKYIIESNDINKYDWTKIIMFKKLAK